MPGKADEPVYFKNRDEFRSWLEKHHDSEKVLWIVYYKKHTGKPGMSYDDAVEEALCFGWIDSTVRTLDDERYKQKFTPRNAKSSWSASNIARAERMIREGRMTEAGLEKYRPSAAVKNSGADAAPAADPDIPPPVLKKSLVKRRGLLARFLKLSSSRRKGYIEWILSAKKEETRVRRAEKLAESLEKNIILMP